REGVIYLRDGGHEQPVCRVAEIKLRGAHNVLNVLAACALAGAAGIEPAAMREAINNFTGVAHRLELVRERNGVKWYNDSIATAPERAMAAIRSFDEPLILLVGGRDKKLPWDDLMALARQRVKALIVFGEAADLIARAAEDENMKVEARRYKMAPKLLNVVKCSSMAEAVQKAAEIAEAGDVVLLSPGGTSYDAFKDFVERGERFREMANWL
ncbi:MAG: cyanophycin synthetase, partial [Chloroflexota bacterium]